MLVCPGGVMVATLDSRLKGSRVRLPAVPLSGNNPRQVVHTHVPLPPSSIGTGQRATMPYSWEGNRRSGVALVMRHRLQWFIHVRAQWPTTEWWAPRLNSSKEYVYGTGTAFTLLICQLIAQPIVPSK